MPREPRRPLPPRQCATCGRTFQPKVGPRGGQPPKRCPACRPSVTELRPTAAPEMPAVTGAQQRSVLSGPVRGQVLEIAAALHAENAHLSNRTVQDCANTLLALCGHKAAGAATEPARDAG